MKNYRLLMLTTLIISGCSMCYELIISSVSSYLVGDSVLQYSVTIGLYMFAMGVGSYLSKFFRNVLFDWFVFIELAIGFIGGISSLVLFFANLYLVTYQPVMFAEIIVIGMLVGAEIPILTRIIEEDSRNLRLTVSSLFSFDYIGGLIGSIAFPLLLLPYLGYFATAFLTGMMNSAAALLIIIKYYGRIKHRRIFCASAAAVILVMAFGTVFSENVSNFVEEGLYRDRVIFSKQTPYQHIVMTKHKDDLRLFIDGNVQFSSVDEYRYHEALVHIPMNAAAHNDNVLVLGGGDGLAVRELLKYENAKVTLVDLDAEIIELCRTNNDIKRINGGSLDSSRLNIVVDDAYKFLEENTFLYDVIIVDLPDPNNETLNKLYTNIFYRMCGNSLAKGGVIAVQSTSPYYAPKAFWCINKTLESEGFNVLPYHIWVPSFGDWGFNMASKDDIDGDISLPDGISARFLTNDNVKSLFVFGSDEEINKKDIEINSLSKPRLSQYYGEAEREWR